MNIGILITGHPPVETVDIYSKYSNAFELLLSGQGFTFNSWECLEGEFPQSVNDADGWLITGSKYGAYEDCLLYTSPSPRDKRQSRMPSSA